MSRLARDDTFDGFGVERDEQFFVPTFHSQFFHVTSELEQVQERGETHGKGRPTVWPRQVGENFGRATGSPTWEMFSFAVRLARYF